IESSDEEHDLSNAKSSVFVKSYKIPDNTDIVKGINLEKNVSIHEFINSYKYMGFQATNLGIGIDEINKMIYYKYMNKTEQKEKVAFTDKHDESYTEYNVKKKECIIWLSFTSNMISSGLREFFVYLAKNKFVDVIVTTAGGIEEDIIKCFSKTYIGDFNLNGKKLRKKGWNRIGNLIVPNDNYCKFEDWLQPLLNNILLEQNEKNEALPSEFISRLGKEINDESSLLYWCYKNDIPVFCPGLTDGSLGDNLFFHNYGKKIKNNLILDIVK
uniref:Deoxyhypusine synthase n=1 Tax=Piliocolobus tephrosceles TaxID=591936 RepID=A0A8C9GMR6_9PRIM